MENPTKTILSKNIKEQIKISFQPIQSCQSRQNGQNPETIRRKPLGAPKFTENPTKYSTRKHQTEGKKKKKNPTHNKRNRWRKKNAIVPWRADDEIHELFHGPRQNRTYKISGRISISFLGITLFIGSRELEEAEQILLLILKKRNVVSHF